MTLIRINPMPRHLLFSQVYEELAARYGRTELSDAVAVTAASWWQSPSLHGAALAALASGAEVDSDDVLDDIYYAYRHETDTDEDRQLLDMLSSWVLAKAREPEAEPPPAPAPAYFLTLPPSESNRIPIRVYRQANLFTEDYTYHRILSCRNHPDLRWSSKNPYTRSVFPLPNGTQTLRDYDECTCPLDDAVVVNDSHWPGAPAESHS